MLLSFAIVVFVMSVVDRYDKKQEARENMRVFDQVQKELQSFSAFRLLALEKLYGFDVKVFLKEYPESRSGGDMLDGMCSAATVLIRENEREEHGKDAAIILDLISGSKKKLDLKEKKIRDDYEVQWDEMFSFLIARQPKRTELVGKDLELETYDNWLTEGSDFAYAPKRGERPYLLVVTDNSIDGDTAMCTRNTQNMDCINAVKNRSQLYATAMFFAKKLNHQ